MDERELLAQERNFSGYVRQRLGRAVVELRNEDRPVGDRLEAAHTYGLSAIPLKWIPAAYVDIREEFEAIKAELTRRPSMEGSGSVQATVFTMSDDEATALAERILAFADRYPRP